MKRYSFSKIMLALAVFSAGNSMAFGLDWDGGAGDWLWFTTTNWNPDGTPSTGGELNLLNIGGTVNANSTVYQSNGSDVTISGSTTTVNFNGASGAYSFYSSYTASSETYLTIQNYATLNTATAVALGQSGTSTVKIDSHALWKSSSYMYVGNYGTAYLDLDNGSSLESSSNINFANYADSAAYTTITSSCLKGAYIYNGYRGTAYMTLDGGVLYADSTFDSGYSTGSYGSLTMDNSSYMNVDYDGDGVGTFYSGYSGTSYITVHENSDVYCQNSSFGYNADSYSYMSIDDYGSSFTSFSNLVCGHLGTSVITLTDKARLRADGQLSIGDLGTLNITDSTVTCGSLTGTGSLNFTSGYLYVGSDLEIGSDSLLGTSCYLGSSHELGVGGTLTNKRGAYLNLSGTSITSENLENYSDIYASNSDVLVGTTFTNSGYLNISGGEIDCGSTFVNGAGGYLSGEGTVSAYLGIYNSGYISANGNLLLDGNFYNYASLSSSGLYNSVNVDGSVINNGDITLTNSTFSCDLMYNQFSAKLSGYGTVSGTIENNGGLIYADGGTLNAGNLQSNTQGGELRIADNSTLRTSTNLYNDGYINMLGSNSYFASLYGIDNDGVISGAGRISATINNYCSLIADGGKLILGSNFYNDTSGLIEVMDGAALMVTRGLSSNFGSIYLYGGRFDNGRNVIFNEGYIVGNGTMSASEIYNNNYLSVGDGDMSIIADIFYNSGIVNVADDCTVTFFGDVSGPGSFSGENGTVVFLANYTPGAYAAGIAGDVTLMGTLLLTLDADESDQLIVGKELVAGGDLIVTLADACVPNVGDSYDLFDAEIISGTFADIILPELSAGNMSWDTSSLYLDGVITVVPEPCTILLLTAGAGMVMGRRKK